MSVVGLQPAAGCCAAVLPHARAKDKAHPGARWGWGHHTWETSAATRPSILQPRCSGLPGASWREHPQGRATGRCRAPRSRRRSKGASPLTARASGGREDAQTVTHGEEAAPSEPGSENGRASPGRESHTSLPQNPSSADVPRPGQVAGEVGRDSTGNRSLLQLLPHLRPHWPLIVRAWACTGVATACLLLFVPRLGQLSEAMGRGDLRGLARKSCAVVALVALRSLCTFLQDAWLWECALGVVADLRQGAFEAVLAQDMGFLETAPGARGRGSRGPPSETPPSEAPLSEAGLEIEVAPGGAEALGTDAALGSEVAAGEESLEAALGSEAAPKGRSQGEEVGAESMALGDVLFRLTVETRECGDVVFALLKAAVPAALQAAAMTSRMVTLSPILTVCTLCVLPAMAVVIAVMGEAVRGVSGRAQRSAAALSDYVSEVLPGLLAVKTQLGGPFEARRFRALVAGDVSARLAKKRAKALFPEAITGAYTLAVTVLFGVSAWAVGRGRLTPGGIVAFFSSLVLLVEPIQAAGSAYNEVKQGQPAVERVLELLRLPRPHRRYTSSQAHAGAQPGGPQPVPETPLKATPCVLPSPPTPLRGSIKLDHVSFRYNSPPPASLAGRGGPHAAGAPGVHQTRELALADVALEIQAGESVAIVGPSGSGKSTLLRLLLRLHSPTAGRITLDGRDIADVEDDTWRRTVGVVTQQTILFSGTVAANIAYGYLPLGVPEHVPGNGAAATNPILGFSFSAGTDGVPMPGDSGALGGDLRGSRQRYTEDEVTERVVRAARLADAHGFISQLPGAYQAQIGRDGCTLSGGQRQRVAIARALFHDPAVLVLDEPTSSLDNLSRRAVQGALQKLMADRTVILVDHKVEAIQGVDRVIYLQDGRVVEDGRAAELLKKEGGYVNALFRNLSRPEG